MSRHRPGAFIDHRLGLRGYWTSSACLRAEALAMAPSATSALLVMMAVGAAEVGIGFFFDEMSGVSCAGCAGVFLLGRFSYFLFLLHWFIEAFHTWPSKRGPPIQHFALEIRKRSFQKLLVPPVVKHF